MSSAGGPSPSASELRSGEDKAADTNFGPGITAREIQIKIAVLIG